MKILFIDPVTPKLYTIDSLAEGRMGGTEATCIRVMRELAKRGYTVHSQQRGNTTFHSDGLINYIPAENPNLAEKYDVIVTLRDGVVYQKAKLQHPNARHYLWMHDVVGGAYADHLNTTLSSGVNDLLAVSAWHKNQIHNALPELTLRGNLRINVMYNPVEDYCKRTDAPYNPKSLVFFSSPHKGLDQVLVAFQALRTKDPDFKLYVSNPGYYPDKEELPENVINLAELNLSHTELMENVRGSLCMFYPQTIFEETFGLVYAEANGVGTPVLAHSLGAAREVLDAQTQIVNCNNLDTVVQTVLRWSNGERPTVSLNKQFSMYEVIKEWVKLIKFSSTGSTK